MRGIRIFSDEATKIAVEECLKHPHQHPKVYLEAVTARCPEFIGKTDVQLRNLLQSERVSRIFDLEMGAKVRSTMRLRSGLAEEKRSSSPPKPALDLSSFSHLAAELAVSKQDHAEERWRKFANIKN